MKMKKYRLNYSDNTAAGGTPSKGSVIFIVLIFIISITTLVLISTLRVSSEADFIEDEFSRLKAYTLCISGVEFLKNRLSTGTRNNVEFLKDMMNPHFPRLFLDGSDIPFHFLDIIKGKYSKRLRFDNPESMGFILNLQDSAGLINVFNIDRVLFKNLLEYYHIPTEKTDIILDSLYDWMDTDSFTRPHGAESQYYLGQSGYPAANRLIESRDELLLIRGIDKYTFTKIGKLLDCNIKNRGVNPNTMPAEVFHLFRGLREENIQRIIQKRREKPFDGANGLTLVSGYNFSAYPTAFQFFTSNTTYVKIKARMNEHENRFFYITFRLDRIGGGGSMRRGSPRTAPVSGKRRSLDEDFNSFYHIYYWQEGTEYETGEEIDTNIGYENE